VVKFLLANFEDEVTGRQGNDQNVEQKVLEIINRHQLTNKVQQVERHEDDRIEDAERVVDFVPVVDDNRQVDGHQGEEEVPEGVALGYVLVLECLFEVAIEV
jgi:hypothetical protein